MHAIKSYEPWGEYLNAKDDATLKEEFMGVITFSYIQNASDVQYI